MPEFTTLPPLALYIHLPWCVKKCPYCDFNSHTFNQGLPEKEYIDALIADLEYQLPQIWGRRIISVFIGGGTPSLFSPESFERLISTLRSHLNFSPNVEITMEANPGTVEQGKFNEFFSVGINRLSIGVQSFDDEKLTALGRIHNSQEAHKAIDVAFNAGFENINLDLMFGLPGQSIKEGIEDLKKAIELSPQHISWYQLTIEPNTLFHSQPPPQIPEDDDVWEMQQQGQYLLSEYGFSQYEISAYAKDQQQCRHNLNYWQFGDYLALGAGAHGKISRSDTGEIKRYWQLRQPQGYMQAKPEDKTSNFEVIEKQQLVFEFMLNALRLKEGVEEVLFERHTGLTQQMILEKCNRAIDDGLLLREQGRLKASAQGYVFLNDLINYFSD